MRAKKAGVKANWTARRKVFHGRRQIRCDPFKNWRLSVTVMYLRILTSCFLLTSVASPCWCNTSSARPKCNDESRLVCLTVRIVHPIGSTLLLGHLSYTSSAAAQRARAPPTATNAGFHARGGEQQSHLLKCTQESSMVALCCGHSYLCLKTSNSNC